MKKIIVLISLTLVNSSIFSQTGWVQQASGTTNNLYSVQFLNSSTGFASGSNGTFLRTTNGGLNWILSSTNLGYLRQLQFLNPSTGFVSGDSGIYRSTNNGANWLRIYTGTDQSYFHFLDINTGFRISSGYYKTTNGGTNWQMLTAFAPGGNVNLIYMSDSIVYAGGWDLFFHFGGLYSAHIIRSFNGGVNWTEPYYSGVEVCCSVVNDLTFPAQSMGYAVGWERSSNYFYKSTNSGNNWSKTSTPGQMYSLAFTNALTGWIIGAGGNVYYTTNSGTNFNPQVSGVSSTLQKIFMIDSLTGWIIGDGGTILSTINGGLTPIDPKAINIPNNFSLSQNYPNPFNPTTNIKFQIAKSSYTKLVIYDALGKEVEILVDKKLEKGEYQADFDGTNPPSGVYFYKLTVNNEQLVKYTETKKMVLIK